MGFYVAKCSQSNYPRTDVSLGSSLNLDYLQNLNDKFTPKNEDRTQLWESILHSTVRYELENAGYKTVAFASGFAFTEMTTADIYLSPFAGLVGDDRVRNLAHPHHPGPPPGGSGPGQSRPDRWAALPRPHRLVLDSMEMLAHMPGPKFVFIHLVQSPSAVRVCSGWFAHQPCPFHGCKWHLLAG